MSYFDYWLSFGVFCSFNTGYYAFVLSYILQSCVKQTLFCVFSLLQSNFGELSSPTIHRKYWAV